MDGNQSVSSSLINGQFVSAPWRSSGKSMVAMGLARCAYRLGHDVQTFKKGPDYIDPMWLKAASHQPCFNLDPYIQQPEELGRLFAQHASGVTVVEGTMGLHDGLAVDGSDSNAAIAHTLGLPVVLVVDCRGMHRTIAALVNGLTQFDNSIEFSGVILNRLRSLRHSQKIESAVNRYCDIPILGAIAENEALMLREQELGLIPAAEHAATDEYIDSVADELSASCNLDSLLQENMPKPVAELDSVNLSTGKKLSSAINTKGVNSSPKPLQIGVAKDEAFHFYYEDDLQELKNRGVSLVEFSPIKDRLPANLDGLLLGGGFPERFAQPLSDNVRCREAIANEIKNGLVVRAECGGLIYLCRSLALDNVLWPMVGVVDGVAKLHRKPLGRGYMKLQHAHRGPFEGTQNDSMAAHEFHHASIDFAKPPECRFRVLRGHGLDGKTDGVVVYNSLASFAHMRHSEATPWIDWFLESIRNNGQTHEQAAYHV